MSSSATKAELQARIAKLERQLSDQRKYIETMRMRVSVAERNVPRGQRELPLHFQKAREAAMRNGRAVRVNTGG